MSKCGVSIDKESLDVFFKQIEGKDVAEAVTEGKKKHVSMPCGGGGAAVGAPAVGDALKAEEKKAELIIVASHQPGLQKYFLGSTAAKVVRHATCSVIVVR